jgi:probable DNA metabolism protein
MQTVLYDGSFDGFLCSVFDIYYYKFTGVDIYTEHRFQGNIFQQPHYTHYNSTHKDRVWKGLQKRLTQDALDQIYYSFLSELPGIENTLLHYIQYALASDVFMEKDFSHPAVLAITQTAKKVWREKHRMEAFVRFQKTGDGLFYAFIEPDYNVLPLLSKHFSERYADQPWLIFDGKRYYGLYYDLHQIAEVEVNFTETTSNGKNTKSIYDEQEVMYQQLWQQYFTSVNIQARKNSKLHIQHMPRRYWKHLPEKQPKF